MTSYVAATVNAVEAANHREYGNEEKAEAARKRATLFLSLGLLCDLGGVLLLVATGADRVERLDAEVAHGGGPITEAYAAAFGLPREEVLAAIRTSLGTAGGSAEVADAQLLEHLLAHAHLTDDAAGRLLYAFHAERGSVGLAPTPWHQALSDLSGVPVAELAPLVDHAIAERLSIVGVPGRVVSARAALAPDAARTLEALLGQVYDVHRAVVDTQMASIPVVGTAAP